MCNDCFRWGDFSSHIRSFPIFFVIRQNGDSQICMRRNNFSHFDIFTPPLLSIGGIVFGVNGGHKGREIVNFVLFFMTIGLYTLEKFLLVRL